MSVDPLADKYPGWNPYHYVHNNPVRSIDPDGMEAEESDWIPDKNTGNMIAETGDNAESLSKNWGYTLQQAQNFIDNSNVKLDGEGNVIAGQTVNVENRFTEIASSQTTDEIGRFVTNGEVQNCHGITCNGGGYYYAGGMDKDLKEYYKPVSKSEAIPLETVVRWGGYNSYAGNGSNNINNHTATTYGFSKDGTMYMATTNGFGKKLQFITLDAVRQIFEPKIITTYDNNKIQGYNPKHSGYYNLK